MRIARTPRSIHSAATAVKRRPSHSPCGMGCRWPGRRARRRPSCALCRQRARRPAVAWSQRQRGTPGPAEGRGGSSTAGDVGDSHGPRGSACRYAAPARAPASRRPSRAWRRWPPWCQSKGKARKEKKRGKEGKREGKGARLTHQMTSGPVAAILPALPSVGDPADEFRAAVQ